MNMRFGICAVVLLAALAASSAAYAWAVYSQTGDNVTIKCGDSSMAAVQGNDANGWTATQAGKSGHTGGHFGIMGQAALYACGE
jgi:hypothetical protein